MSRKEEVLTYCQKMNKPLTAKEIVNGLYPGKAQPFVNHLLIDLVEEKKLVRNDDERPYTVRPLREGEVIEQVRNYSRKKKPSHNDRSQEGQNKAPQEQGVSGSEPYASRWQQGVSGAEPYESQWQQDVSGAEPYESQWQQGTSGAEPYAPQWQQGVSGPEPCVSQWGQDAPGQASAEPARQGRFNYLDNWEKLEYHLRQLEQCLWLLVRERMGD